MKTCPRCQEALRAEAIVCTHCGHQFGTIPATGSGNARPTPDRWKVGCAILIIAAIAAALWAFSSDYLSQSPEAAAAIEPDPGGEAQPNGRQGR